ncbi:CxC2 domain-containing protein [Mycena venus]|uniref:CxC2 domain-containing protein n=1 Tax=Mycena venus TaxID=2733690 RepID=A0A8H6X7T7_9AGAR|nr:CxC2 domain-containing protein [Mycena venus]
MSSTQRRRGRPSRDSGIDEGRQQLGKTFVANRGVYISVDADGLNRMDGLTNIAYKKQRVEPTDLRDHLASWVPVPEGDFYSSNTDLDAEAQPQTEAETGSKRKEYASSNPMFQWRPLKGRFLDELLRHEGLGDNICSPRCAHCDAEFRSDDLSAMQKLLSLASPALASAFHRGQRQEWNGMFWVPETLEHLGLIYQLGHGGFPCPLPDPTVQKMVLIEAPFIHTIRLRYCNCGHSGEADNVDQLLRNMWYPATPTDPATCATFRTLEVFRLYNVVGNMNVRDFVTAMERMTNTTAFSGLGSVPDRVRPFQRMARQWAFLMRLKRAGRGHDPAGVDATRLGQCAVNCWACPHDGKNLPPDWRTVDPKYQFLYMLLIAIDANFRLKNRIRANELEDPPLGPGWGYWVEPKGYQEHVRHYVTETDISTCIAFAALLQKDTRMTTGLRVSGVGGCVCARHECMRPNGLGDLQKGERYCNMDWIAFSAIMGLMMLFLTISYDIACQWKVNVAERMARLPPEMHMDLSKVQVQFGLPVWHAGSHDCREDNSLSFKAGVGKTDGEGIERTWAVLNPAALATKEMGLGNRADVLDDRIDNHNFLKNLTQGHTLKRKLVVALAERQKQVQAFQAVNDGVHKELLKVWKQMIRDWLKDSSKPNPYVLQRKDCPTEAEVRLQLQRDEKQQMLDGRADLAGRSATAFLAAGIQIEDTQRRIIAQLKGTALLTADRESRVEEWRRNLLAKISRFRALQEVYVPGASAAISSAEASREPDAPPPQPEHIKLFMPSEMRGIGTEDRLWGCLPGLLEMETRLRVSQCLNCLSEIRSRLHAKLALGVEKDYLHLRELKQDDLRLDGDTDNSDLKAQKKLATISARAGQGARASRNMPGTSRRVMSWIWTAPGAFDQDGADLHLHDSIRVEWACAQARKERWEEEVMLLREEMRRVLRYLEWQARWWRDQASRRSDLDAVAAAGAKAYALKQATWSERLHGFLRAQWDSNAATSVQEIIAIDDLVHLENAVRNIIDK